MVKNASKDIIIYSDGACLGNPGPGGWAAILLWNNHHKEISGGFAHTTNNRMEIMAVLEALRTLKQPCSIVINTDSRYLHDAVEKKWIQKWQKNGWKTTDKKPVKNQDLWEQLSSFLDQHQIRFQWVKAHDGQKENERCDQLAKQAANQPDLPRDHGLSA